MSKIRFSYSTHAATSSAAFFYAYPDAPERRAEVVAQRTSWAADAPWQWLECHWAQDLLLTATSAPISIGSREIAQAGETVLVRCVQKGSPYDLNVFEVETVELVDLHQIDHEPDTLPSRTAWLRGRTFQAREGQTPPGDCITQTAPEGAHGSVMYNLVIFDKERRDETRAAFAAAGLEPFLLPDVPDEWYTPERADRLSRLIEATGNLATEEFWEDPRGWFQAQDGRLGYFDGYCGAMEAPDNNQPHNNQKETDMEAILTAESALNQVADTFKARGERGDGRAAALARTLAELAGHLPERATGDDLALYFRCAADAADNGRPQGQVHGRKVTCAEILALLEALDAQPDEGGLLVAAAIGDGWRRYAEGQAARYTAMAVTYKAEQDSAWMSLTGDLWRP